MITVPFFCFKDKLHLMYFKRYIELSIFILITLFTMFNVVTYSEAIKHYTLRMQMLMTASKDYSLGNVQHCRQKCFFFFLSLEGFFNAAVLRGTASMILLSLTQRHFLFYLSLFAR